MANYPDAKLNVTGDWRQAGDPQVVNRFSPLCLMRHLRS
jgi:hypothetical protein